MKHMRWVGFIAVLLLVVACFIPWVFIASKNIIVTGIESSGTNFGKPGYVHFVFCFLFFIFHSFQKVWAKRCNLFVVALNGAWIIRNYFPMGGDITVACTLELLVDMHFSKRG